MTLKVLLNGAIKCLWTTVITQILFEGLYSRSQPALSYANQTCKSAKFKSCLEPGPASFGSVSTKQVWTERQQHQVSDSEIGRMISQHACKFNSFLWLIVNSCHQVTVHVSKWRERCHGDLNEPYHDAQQWQEGKLLNQQASRGLCLDIWAWVQLWKKVQWMYKDSHGEKEL